MTAESIQKVQALLTVDRNGDGKKKIIDVEVLLKRHRTESVVSLLKGLLKEKQKGLIKQWARAIHLKGNYGAHSLRKTFGFIQRTKYAVGFEVLAKRFNHSSPTITMRY
jgi:integrase